MKITVLTIYLLLKCSSMLYTHIRPLFSLSLYFSKQHCKHFNRGKGTCPFGNSCFYKHGIIQHLPCKSLQAGLPLLHQYRVWGWDKGYDCPPSGSKRPRRGEICGRPYVRQHHHTHYIADSAVIHPTSVNYVKCSLVLFRNVSNCFSQIVGVYWREGRSWGGRRQGRPQSRGWLDIQ